MKTIIRIEHQCGNGLWKAQNSEYVNLFYLFSFSEKLMNKHNLFPIPEQEGLILEEDDYCAFKSIEQIQQWIESKWFKEIINAGFNILMLDVSEWKEGEHQILFKKKHILSSKIINQLF